LRSIQRKQRIALLVMSLRGVAISVRTRSLAGMRRGIAQIADALREPLP
jgi:hypothetical protein